MTLLDLARKWRHNKIMLRALLRSRGRELKRRLSDATESASQETIQG